MATALEERTETDNPPIQKDSLGREANKIIGPEDILGVPKEKCDHWLQTPWYDNWDNWKQGYYRKIF